MKNYILLLFVIIATSGIKANADTHIHTWSDWNTDRESDCSTEGQMSRYCLECYATETKSIPKKDHAWGEWDVTEKPSAFHTGEKERYCDSCGQYEYATIPKRSLSSNEKKAQSIANTYMKKAKKYDWKGMDKMFAKGSKKYGYPTVSSITKYYKKYNKKMLKWTVTDITGSGSKYNVHVNVTRPDLYIIMRDPFYKQLVKVWNSGNRSSKVGEKAGVKAVKEYQRKLKKGCKKTTTRTVVIPVVRSGGKWKIKSKSRDVVDIATGHFNEAMENATSDFYEYVGL